jgi:hypothetical protein
MDEATNGDGGSGCRSGVEEDGPRVDPTDDPLAAWGVGTLHASLFVLAPVVVAHAGGALGDLLAGVGTLAGLALFAYLWAAVGLASRRWLRGVDPDRPLDAATGGATWGAAAGLGFLPGVVLAVLVATGNLPLAAVLLLAGALVAPLVGATSGALLAVVDVAFLRTARRLAPVGA